MIKLQFPVSMVVFDMAGTTINENNLVYHTLHEALVHGGVNVSFEQVLRQGAGMEKRAAIAAVVDAVLEPEFSSEALIDRLFDSFKIELAKGYEQAEVLPQPTTLKVFEALRQAGIKIVLNTGYNRATAQTLIAKLGWQIGEDIDLLVTADDVELGRPSPAMIEKAIQYFGITDPSTTVKVGDSTVDIAEGRNAGCGLVVGVTTGAHTTAQLNEASPDLVIDRLEDLLAVLRVSVNV